MFKKIVSNLPFSPALVGQLGFYTKRLKKEEVSRRLGLMFLVLTLIVQTFAVFQPPESANATSDTDMVAGGISSISDYLKSYDSNTKHLQDTMSYIGITRNEIKSATYTTFAAGDKLSWGFAPRFSYAQGERQHIIYNAKGVKVTTVYSRPLRLWGNSNMIISAWKGHSETVGWFAIMKSCGNLVTETLPPPPKPPKPPRPCLLNPNILASDKNCKPCPGDDSVWINDESCVPNIVMSKNATNTSQGFVNASSVTAHSGDQISYTLTIENTGLSPKKVKLDDHLGDVLEYSTLIDNGGGSFDNTTKILSWSDVVLNPNEKQTRTFVIKVLDEIPATASGASDPTSYDCIMSNVFGNSVNVNVNCPAPKIVEQVANELPKTGPTENLIFSGIIFAIATYFYVRTHQVRREIQLIRKDVSTGTL